MGIDLICRIVACVLMLTLQTAIADATPLPPQKMTLLLEFSVKNSEAYHLQMQHWNLVQTALGSLLEVHHEHVSLQRSLELVQQPGFCAINKMKTPERLAKLIFSDKPINISPSLRLIRLGAEDETAAVDLAAWLASSKKLKLGIAGGRSYGAMLDQLLLKHPNQIYQLSGEDVHVKLWQMLQKGRIDALIDYSVRINHLHKISPAAMPFSVTQIVGQRPIIEGYLVCAPTEQGKHIVALVNQVLETPELQQALFHSYQQYFSLQEWQSVASLIQHFYPLAKRY